MSIPLPKNIHVCVCKYYAYKHTHVCRQTAQILQTTNIRLGSLHRLTELQPASVINGCLICYTLLCWDTAEIKINIREDRDCMFEAIHHVYALH